MKQSIVTWKATRLRAWALLFSLPYNVMGYETVCPVLISFLEVLQIWRIKKAKNSRKWERNNFRMKNMIFPHKFWRSFWIACLSYFFKLQYVWLLVHMYIAAIINSSGQLAELIVYMIPLEQRCFVCAFKQRKTNQARQSSRFCWQANTSITLANESVSICCCIHSLPAHLRLTAI